MVNKKLGFGGVSVVILVLIILLVGIGFYYGLRTKSNIVPTTNNGTSVPATNSSQPAPVVPQVTNEVSSSNPWLCLLNVPLESYRAAPDGFRSDFYYNSQDSFLSSEKATEAMATSYTNLVDKSQMKINVENYQSAASVDKPIKATISLEQKNFSGTVQEKGSGYSVLSYTSSATGKTQLYMVYSGTRLGFFQFYDLKNNPDVESLAKLEILKKTFCP